MRTEPPRWADDSAREEIDTHFSLHFDEVSCARSKGPDPGDGLALLFAVLMGLALSGLAFLV